MKVVEIVLFDYKSVLAFLYSSFSSIQIQGFTYPVRTHFLEDVLEITGYKLTSFNQIDDYGQEKVWKTQKQLVPRKKKNQINALVEVIELYSSTFYMRFTWIIMLNVSVFCASAQTQRIQACNALYKVANYLSRSLNLIL